jgi:hypothetical protein
LGELIANLSPLPYALDISLQLTSFLPRPPNGDMLVLNILIPATVALAAFVSGRRAGKPKWLHGRLGAFVVLFLTLCYAVPVYRGFLNSPGGPMSGWFPDYEMMGYLGLGVFVVAAFIYWWFWVSATEAARSDAVALHA